MKKYIKKWKDILNLTTEIRVEIVSEEDMNIIAKNKNADKTVLGGVSYNKKFDRAILFLSDDREETILHELLHIKFPDDKEEQIEQKTKLYKTVYGGANI